MIRRLPKQACRRKKGGKPFRNPNPADRMPDSGRIYELGGATIFPHPSGIWQAMGHGVIDDWMINTGMLECWDMR